MVHVHFVNLDHRPLEEELRKSLVQGSPDGKHQRLQHLPGGRLRLEMAAERLIPAESLTWVVWFC